MVFALGSGKISQKLDWFSSSTYKSPEISRHNGEPSPEWISINESNEIVIVQREGIEVGDYIFSVKSAPLEACITLDPI